MVVTPETDARRSTAAAITCRLESPSGASRRNEPVTVGVPFPQGWCQRVDDLRLCASDGTALPLQARVLDRWIDGSARWALLDFQASRAATAACEYELVG